MSIGNRVLLRRPLADTQVIQAFKEIPAPNIADILNRSCALSPDIKLISSPKEEVMVGSALTVKTRAGDNLFLHKALDMAGEGDVIVVSNEGGKNRALLGEIMISLVAGQKKIAGIVLDGPIRDSKQLKEMDFFLYATGTTPGGPYKSGPGEINVPICCGGAVINPGDIVIADADGVIVIPQRRACEVLRRAQQCKEDDQNKLQAVLDGHARRTWVDKTLQDIDCEIIDDSYENII